jgi:hypothetical protein
LPHFLLYGILQRICQTIAFLSSKQHPLLTVAFSTQKECFHKALRAVNLSLFWSVACSDSE